MADYSDVVGMFPPEPDVANARLTVPSNPDQTAKALPIAKQLNIPPILVESDPAFWGEQARVQGARQYLGKTPLLAPWLANDPTAARLANDDIPALANVAAKIPEAPPVGSFFDSIGRGWTATEHNRAVADAVMGIGDLPPPLLPAPQPSGVLDRIENTLGTFIGGMASTVVHALPAAAGGAVIGAGVGAAGGAPAGPVGAAVGAAGGALVGGARGLAYGIAADMALTAAGSTYEETGTYRDGDGNPLPEGTRKFAALATGTVTAVLAMALPGASKETLAAGKALIQETITQAVPRITGEIAKIGLKGGLLNAAFTAAQSIPEELAKLSTGGFDTVINDPQARQDFIDRHVESFIDGVLLFATTHGLSTATRAGGRAIANMGATQLDTLVEAAADTKLHTRSPEALTEFIRSGNREEIGISPTADSTALAKIASPEDIQRAVETGGDVHVPLSEYVAQVDPATHAALRDDIRWTPDGMTLREAAEVPPLEVRPVEAPPVAPAAPERIASAAVKEGNNIYSAPTHIEALERMSKATGEPIEDLFSRDFSKEGFLTTTGRYVSREEASRIAADQGQVAPIGDLSQAASTDLIRRTGEMYAESLIPAAEMPPARRVSTLTEAPPAAAAAPATAAATMQERLGGTREAALAQTRSSLYLEPLLKEPLPGMTQADFARYSRLLEAQAARAAEVPEPLAEARAEIEAQVDRRRDVAALAALIEREELRLNPDDISPRQLPYLPKEILREGGAHPDDIAATLRYRSGAEMVRELANLARGGGRDALIDKAIDRLSYGDTINRALNSKQLDVLIAETRALGGPELTREDLRQTVQERFDQTPLNQATKRAATLGIMARQGQLAESALLRNDMAAALVAKQRQAVAFEMARLQRGLEKEVAAFDRLADPYANRKIVANRDPEYTAHIQSMIAALGRPISRSAAELRTTHEGFGSKSLSDFIQGKRDDGRIISDPGGLPIHLPFEEWSVEDFRQLHKVIQTLDHSSAKEAFFQAVDKAIGVDTLIQAIVTNLADRQERVDPFNAGGLKSVGRNVDARFLKMERLFDWIDKNDPNGPLNQIFRMIKSGQFSEDDMLKEARTALKAIDDPAVRGRFRELVDNPFSDVDGRPMKLNHGNKIAMALNWGTRSNRDKLTRGFKWDRDAVGDWLMRNMSQADWKFVQGVWDLFGRYWKPADDVVRRMSGIGMDQVEALPVQTPFGPLRGGYYPIEYDPLRSNIARIREGDLFQRSGGFNPLPPAGYTKTRTGVAMPLRLDLDFIGNRLGETIHDIAYREALTDANKILGNKRVTDAITRAFGPEYTEQIRPWLQYIANRSQTDDAALGWINDLSRQARMNANVLAIGWNVTTSMVHTLSALSNSMREAGPGYFLAATSEFFRNPTQMRQLWEWADSKFGELRNRKHNMDRDMQDVLRQWDVTQSPSGLPSIRQRFQLFMMSMIATGDKLSAVPTAIAGYRKALAQGMNDADAVAYANKVVRNAHGAGGLPDLSPIMRGPEAMRWFTMFMSYFNHNYNQVRDVGREYAAGYQDIKAGNMRTGSEHFVSAAGGTLAYLIIPALIHELFKQGLPGSQPGDSWGAWTARALEGQVLSMFPLVRDVANFAIHQHGRSIEVASPLSNLLQTMYDPLADLARATHIAQGPVSKQWVRHALAAPTAFFGIGLPTQLARAGQFLWDTTSAGGYHQYATTPVEWMHGLLYGQSHPKPQHTIH